MSERGLEGRGKGARLADQKENFQTDRENATHLSYVNRATLEIPEIISMREMAKQRMVDSY